MIKKIDEIERMETLHDDVENAKFIHWFYWEKERNLKRVKAKLKDDMWTIVESVFDEDDKRLIYEIIEDKSSIIFNVNLEYLVEFRKEMGGMPNA